MSRASLAGVLLVLLPGCKPDEGDDTAQVPDVVFDFYDHLDAFIANNYAGTLTYEVQAATLITADTAVAGLGDVAADDAWMIADGGFVQLSGQGRADHLSQVLLPALVPDAVLVRLEWTMNETTATTWAIIAPGPHDLGDAIGFYEPITSTWRTPGTEDGALLAFADGWGTIRTHVTGGLTCPEDNSCANDLVAADDVPGCFAAAVSTPTCVPNGSCDGDVEVVAWCGAPGFGGAGDYGHQWLITTVPASVECGCGDLADFDADGVTFADGDCDDDDDDVKPGATELCDLVDSNCNDSVADEFPDFEGDDLPDCADPDDDGDGSVDSSDCAPMNNAIHPGATELCDAIDSDCDLDLVDGHPNFDSDAQPDCVDGDDDNDGSADALDCNDTNASVKPGATESCDDVDTDCDLDLVDGFPNNDADPEPNCIDGDDDNDLSLDQNDCDDANNAIYPGAIEACDSVDSNCNGSLVDGAANYDNDTQPDCVDTDDDNDGSLDAADCNDANANVYPGAAESCDGVDSDCDGSLIDGASNFDGDAQPDCFDTDDDNDSSLDTADCNDANNAIYPGATEACDGVDSDCDGSLIDGASNFDGDTQPDCFDTDDDNDSSLDTADCNDANNAIYPGATESCDSIDSDCDGSLVDNDTNTDGDTEPNCIDTDDDNDGDLDATDCNDTNANVHAGATDVCTNYTDDDCDNVVDENCWWVDYSTNTWLPARGGGGGSDFEEYCPTDKVAVGLTVDVISGHIGGLSMTCLDIADDGTIPTGQFSSVTPWHGGVNTPARTTDYCDLTAHRVMDGQYVYVASDSIVSHLRMTCSSVAVDGSFIDVTVGAGTGTGTLYADGCTGLVAGNSDRWAITAIGGFSGALLDNVQFRCTRLRDHR